MQYEGEWKEDYPWGSGTLIWIEHNGVNKILRNRYAGQFERGMRHGLGIFYYANGATYEGYWYQNKKHGYATYTNENGEVTYCLFNQDRMSRKIYVADSLINSLANNKKVKSRYTQYKSAKDLGLKTEEASMKSVGYKDNEKTLETNPGGTPPQVPPPVASPTSNGKGDPKPKEGSRSKPAEQKEESNKEQKDNIQISQVVVPQIPLSSDQPKEDSITENLYLQLIDMSDILTEDNSKRIISSVRRPCNEADR